MSLMTNMPAVNQWSTQGTNGQLRTVLACLASSSSMAKPGTTKTMAYTMSRSHSMNCGVGGGGGQQEMLWYTQILVG